MLGHYDFTPGRQPNVRIPLFLTALIALAIYAVSIASLARPAQLRISPVFLRRPSAEPIVEIEGLSLGQSFEPLDETIHADERFEIISQALLERFVALNVSVEHPQCSLNLSRYESSGIIGDPAQRDKTSERITIALNLFNSESILPSLSLALLELVAQLQPSHEIYISIFENDSTDLTRALLGELAAALLSLGINGVIFRSSTLHRSKDLERIIGLANLRNEALYPLLSVAADGTLLFINDVVTCGFDLLELLHQLRLQKATAVMSTDWEVVGVEEAQFRDTWVARGINGDLAFPMAREDGFSQYAPHGSWLTDFLVTQNESIHQRWLDGRPIPMYSGWNGAIAFKANLFTEYHVRFRASGQGVWRGGDVAGRLGAWGRLIATPGYLESDCAASECKLLARDVWNLLGGKARFVLAPQSRMTYELNDWRVVSRKCPPTQWTGAEGLEEELIDWSNVTMPTEVVCVPILNATGQDTDPWGDGNVRTKIDPYFPAYQPRAR